MGLKKFIGNVALQAGMASCSEYLELIQLVIDNESTKVQEGYLRRHMRHCTKCLEKFELDEELKKAIRMKLENREVPPKLAESIKTKITNSV